MRVYPLQARAAQRLDSILAAAADEFAVKGYEAATLTSVAQRAGTSIGSVYRYFPDKSTIAGSLLDRYSREAADAWIAFTEGAVGSPIDAIVDGMVGVVDTFVRERPAYAPLALGAPPGLHNTAAIEEIFRRIGRLFMTVRPSLDEAEARTIVYLVQNTLFKTRVETTVGKLALGPDMGAEARVMLTAYLTSRLAPP